MQRILLIEDDKVLSDGVLLALKSDKISVEQCFSIKTARGRMAEEIYDLLLLDVNLPDGNGVDFMQEVKRKYKAPVILLTANDLEIDIVTGLELGADDYVTKPFQLAVLRARVHTQLRRQEELAKAQRHKTTLETVYVQDDFRFDFERMEFCKENASIELSLTEQKLLRILTLNRGIVLSRGRLIDYVWTDGAEYVNENALSVSVKRLRDKLEKDSSNPRYIKTIYGIGYMWEAE